MRFGEGPKGGSHPTKECGHDASWKYNHRTKRTGGCLQLERPHA